MRSVSLKWWWIVGIGILAVALIVLVASISLPSKRAGQAERIITASPEAILSVIVDVHAQPKWRKDVRSVESDGSSWVETTTSGERIRFEWISRTTESLALRFTSDRGFTGQWRATLSPISGGTLVRVHEEATIPNPIARLVARLAFDPAAFSQAYLEALSARMERSL
jgi:hypothetical protein